MSAPSAAISIWSCGCTTSSASATAESCLTWQVSMTPSIEFNSSLLMSVRITCSAVCRSQCCEGSGPAAVFLHRAALCACGLLLNSCLPRDLDPSLSQTPEAQRNRWGSALPGRRNLSKQTKKVFLSLATELLPLDSQAEAPGPCRRAHEKNPEPWSEESKWCELDSRPGP